MKKIISEAKRQEKANDVKIAMLESFASTFNKIRRD